MRKEYNLSKLKNVYRCPSCIHKESCKRDSTTYGISSCNYYESKDKVKINNQYRCKNCGDIIESKHHHDWVACRCYENKIGSPGIWCDGGQDYSRIGGNLDNILILKNKRWVPIKLEK
jgi:DNA-directed RNA polymerase subunit RPC12/RpoP